jgi:hypothetical protein
LTALQQEAIRWTPMERNFYQCLERRFGSSSHSHGSLSASWSMPSGERQQSNGCYHSWSNHRVCVPSAMFQHMGPQVSHCESTKHQISRPLPCHSVASGMEHITAKAVAGWINKLFKEISPQIPDINFTLNSLTSRAYSPLIKLLKSEASELYFDDECRKPSYMVTCHLLLSKFDL